MKKVTVVIYLLLVAFMVSGQENISWNDTTKAHENPEQRNWKDIRLISVPTTKTVDKHHTEFAIMHRFGNMGGASGGGPHTLYGFDVASDIYFDFNYGILDNLQIGIGRSKQQELIDGNIKYRPLTQKAGGSPVSLAIFGDIGAIPEDNSVFYTPGDMSNHSVIDRLVYLTQVIVSRRLNRHISLELLPTLSFRNHVLAPENTNNGTFDENIIPAIGGGLRYSFNGTIGIVADYYYIISSYRVNNPSQTFYNSFSIGLELHTGGHVFEITLSNASALIPTNIIPNTTNAWASGGFKLGFSISRLF